MLTPNPYDDNSMKRIVFEKLWGTVVLHWVLMFKIIAINEQKHSQICYQGTVGEGIHCDTGIDTYTLLYTKQTTNKDLPYTTGNSTQYSVMTYMGKEPKWTYTKKAYTYTHTHTHIYINPRIDAFELWFLRRLLRVLGLQDQTSQS